MVVINRSHRFKLQGDYPREVMLRDLQELDSIVMRLLESLEVGVEVSPTGEALRVAPLSEIGLQTSFPVPGFPEGIKAPVGGGTVVIPPPPTPVTPPSPPPGSGKPTEPAETAYATAVRYGFIGTEYEFYQMLMNQAEEFDPEWNWGFVDLDFGRLTEVVESRLDFGKIVEPWAPSILLDHGRFNVNPQEMIRRNS